MSTPLLLAAVLPAKAQCNTPQSAESYVNTSAWCDNALQDAQRCSWRVCPWEEQNSQPGTATFERHGTHACQMAAEHLVATQRVGKQALVAAAAALVYRYGINGSVPFLQANVLPQLLVWQCMRMCVVYTVCGSYAVCCVLCTLRHAGTACRCSRHGAM